MTRDEMHLMEIEKDAGLVPLTLYEKLATFEPGDRDALVLIDVQHSFMPGGALGVTGGDEIIAPIVDIAGLFDNLVLTQDWHPRGHSSFASSHPGKAPFDTFEAEYGTQVLWPDHCVAGSKGAEFALPEHIVNKAQLVIRKGFHPQIDSYSAFQENDQKTRTGLASYLEERGIKRIFLAGLATDYCVGFSALDARTSGIEVVLIQSACRGIASDSTFERMDEMAGAGVIIV